jgi:hypothetical protein
MSAVDPFKGIPEGGSVPADDAVAVTPHDTTQLATVSRGLYVGGAGNVAVLMASGQTVTFVGVAAGSVLPIRVARVNSTNTTATNIVALY